MRAIASAQAETCNNNVETSAVPGLLANPLLENPATQPAQEELSATPRFDFYTDPSAAFSANRKRTATANQVARGQRIPEVTPSSAYQMQSNYSPNQRMYPGQRPDHNAAFYGIPRGFAGPFTMNQGTPSEMWSGSGYGGSPASSGRGQGYWDNSSGRGQSGGRGRGFRSRGFALNETQEPECFYDNSMVEDPWQHLKPVLWRGLGDLESSTKSTSGQSLAEYLSAAFTEAANDEPNV
ncbi:PROTEIN SICKLE [Salix purpurea]|uniref:PROTEIN SICKLE n=1 Tax=Salix purpurea TaxID=77065 RepID=A0A9Q0PCI3_SALPP|nr:PROTEIN SICKLE [Salix purpurea]